MRRVEARVHAGMIDEARYVRWSIERTPALATEVLGDEAVARRVAEDVRGTLRERTDPGWLARYRQACPVPGVDASAYALREVRLGDDLAVLAGIHFYGGDVERPFVGVFAQTRDLTSHERRDATVPLVDAFAGFVPRATWWWVAGDDEVGAPAIADQRLLLGAIADLTRRPVARADLPFALRRDDRGKTYAAYRALFDAFLAAHPAWIGRIERTAREDYEACAVAGGLVVAKHEAELVGVFAARPGQVRGVPGWLVEEELLAEGWRGRGLAPLLQRAALARLDAHAHPLVLGTIDAGNVPSWRTARRVGRTDVGGWCFVPDPRRPVAAWLPSRASFGGASSARLGEAAATTFATTRGEPTMKANDPYAKKMQAQIDEWRAEVDKLEAQVRGASADAQIQLKEQIEALQGKIENGNAELTALLQKGEEAWEKLTD